MRCYPRRVPGESGLFPSQNATTAAPASSGCTSMTGGFDVVTGGAGFIGSHLVDRLLSEGRRVRVVDSLVVGRRSNLSQHDDKDELELIEADVTDRPAMLEACSGASRVFHLAARADIVPSIEHPFDYFRANVDGTFAVVEAARACGVRRLIYVASSSCYGIPTAFPTPENALIDCRYPYALTKHLGEQLVLHWADVYKLPALSLRLFNVYGPRARTTGTYGAVFGVFLAQLLAGKPLTVVGDGDQTRDFTYVSDVVDALVMAAESDLVGAVYNVGTGSPVSVNELVRLLGSPPTVHVPRRPGEPDCTWADTSRIRAELGWSAKVPFKAGVRQLLKHIEHWSDAPVWTVDSIDRATTSWFRHLSAETTAGAGSPRTQR